MRIFGLLITLILTSTLFAQSFQLDKIRSPFDRSLKDYSVLSEEGKELFYLKAESYHRHEFEGGAWQEKETRYYRVILPDRYMEAEIPYVSKRKLKRFIRQQRLIKNDRLAKLAADKVVRLFPPYYTEERLAVVRGKR